MKYPFKITHHDPKQALQIVHQVQLGHYFVFIRDTPSSPLSHKLKRLFVKKDENKNKVLPLIDKPITFEGVTITPAQTPIDPLGTVVTERDLYRAEQDIIRLFIAFPKAPKNLHLVIKFNDQVLINKKVELIHGLAIETFSMLPSGRYSAQLSVDDHLLGIPTLFTVAEYTLAPLSARLLSHTLKREIEQLWFELAVESYQRPYSEELLISLVENDLEINQIGLLAHSPGRYTGGMKITGDGPFRLRLTAANDAERVAEVALPGSRKVEREVTIISELGQEKGFSMMPEVNAIPLRGGYLTTGDFLATPVTVEEVVTPQPLLQINTHMESLILIRLDLTSGRYSVQDVGDVSAGDTVSVVKDAPMSTVFIGGFVNGQPFEGYTTFIEPLPFQLSLQAPQTIQPRTDLVLRLTCENTDKSIPVLLSVHDERLTVRDKPEVSLGAAAKRAIDTAIEGMNDWTFHNIYADELEDIALAMAEEFGLMNDWTFHNIYADELEDIALAMAEEFGLPLVDIDSVELNPDTIKLLDQKLLEKHKALPIFKRGNRLFVAVSAPINSTALDEIRFHVRMHTEVIIAEKDKLQKTIEKALELFDTSMGDLGGELGDIEFCEELGDVVVEFCEDLSLDDDLSLDLDDTLSLESEAFREKSPPPTESKKTLTESQNLVRTEWPETLFYDIVSVTGPTEVVIPLSDSLATFTVEAFAMSEGHWTQNQTTVVVDKPVRVDLELPLAVHHDDKVIGRLRAITPSGKAHVTLTHNGNQVTFESQLTALIEKGKTIETPNELDFYVKSGRYIAQVIDPVTNETDTLEMIVSQPGQFKSYIKAFSLLQAGETLTRKQTDILNLRILPTLDTPFETLITATADYTHLCCEQTAAKILAATSMYLTAKNEGQRYTAEQIILAGLAREKKMFKPGRGFKMYPETDWVSDYYSRLAVRYLRQLGQLKELPYLSEALCQAVREGLSLADKAGNAHQMQRLPGRIDDIEAAYTFALLNKTKSEVLQYIEQKIDFSGQPFTLKKNQDAVATRKILAYAAASLIALGDLKHGISLANQVTRQLNAQGRLYSTEDSVAAIALMTQLKKLNLFTGKNRLRVNGEEMTNLEAEQLKKPIETIEVLEEGVAVEVTRMIKEDWQQFVHQFPVQVAFKNSRDQTTMTRFKAGERTDLVISLPNGYQIGDLVHVALPAALSWIQGGGKVKRFTQDFEGQNYLRIPLIVTSRIEGKQHFAVCVRNMFKEERASSPGILSIEGLCSQYVQGGTGQ